MIQTTDPTLPSPPPTASPSTVVDPSTPAARRRCEPDRGWPERLWVTAWVDPLVDRFGHDPRSLYVETFWLGVLGPSTIWLLRRLANLLDAHPDGTAIDLEDTAGALGIGGRTGRHAPLHRALDRCVTFGMAQHSGTTLAVRRYLPPLARRHLVRLPLSVQQYHAVWSAGQSSHHDSVGASPDATITPTDTGAGASDAAGFDPRPSQPGIPPGPDSAARDIHQRARQLALSLVRMGDDRTAVEQQLARWKIHPAIAHDAANWATDQKQPVSRHA
jgi:hypothetical protein